MRLKKGLMIHKTPDGYIAVATGDAARSFNGMMRLSETAAFIMRALQTETTPEAVADALVEQYEVTREVALADVENLICRLEKAGMMYDGQ